MNVMGPVALLSDSTADISDVWMEETDPENARGEVCTALFDHATGYDDNGTFTIPSLIGLRVDDGHAPAFYRRDRAVAFLGYETVCRIEDIHMQELSEAGQ